MTNKGKEKEEKVIEGVFIEGPAPAKIGKDSCVITIPPKEQAPEVITKRKITRVPTVVERNPLDTDPKPVKVEEEKKRVIRGVIVGGLMS